MAFQAVIFSNEELHEFAQSSMKVSTLFRKPCQAITGNTPE
jgi:hypothetical protein